MLKRSLTRFLISPLAIMTLLLLSGMAMAQSDTGKISGYTKDANGAIVPGASVSVVNEKTGEERNARANDTPISPVPTSTGEYCTSIGAAPVPAERRIVIFTSRGALLTLVTMQSTVVGKATMNSDGVVSCAASAEPVMVMATATTTAASSDDERFIELSSWR